MKGWIQVVSNKEDFFIERWFLEECLKCRRCCHAVAKERLAILVMKGTRIDAQSFNREVDIGSSSHYLLGRDCNI